MPDTTTLLALLTGHLLGDFVLQTDALSARKARRRRWIVAHAALAAAATWILLGAFAAAWVAGGLFVLHLGIDLVGRGRTHGAGWFALDQALHVCSLVALWWAIGAFAPDLATRSIWTGLWASGYAEGLLLSAGAITTVWAMGEVLKHQMASFAAGLPPELANGLPRAGRTVGQLERLLIFVFVMIGKPEAVGFLVAAKSVFRIGDLTSRHQRNHAEYIMIGTLRSFAYALVLALATGWLLERMRS